MLHTFPICWSRSFLYLQEDQNIFYLPIVYNLNNHFFFFFHAGMGECGGSTLTGFSADDGELLSSEAFPLTSESLLSSAAVSKGLIRLLADTLVSFSVLLRFLDPSEFCIFRCTPIFFFFDFTSSSSSLLSLSEESALSLLLTFLDALPWELFLRVFFLGPETWEDFNTW